MGVGTSHGEYIDAYKEGRQLLASRYRDVDCAIKIEWSDTGISGAEKIRGVKVSLNKIENLENWIIGKIKEDGKHKSLSIIIDLGRDFKDTRVMPSLITTIAPVIQPLTLNGCTVASIKVTGEFDTTAILAQREAWWRDFVKLSNYAGLVCEVGCKYQIDPLGIDQIGVNIHVDHLDKHSTLLTSLARNVT